MSDPVIALSNVSIKFRLHKRGERHKFVSNRGTQKVGGNIVSDATGTSILALNGISANIYEGDRVALIGHNGAGKSTLLRTLAGIYSPTSGKCKVIGRKSCLLSVGLGLNGEATLIENIRLALALYGKGHAEANEMIEGILEFAELAEFANVPLHTCSAGMKARLGFSVATAVKPEVFLVDEALGAGDASFAIKASERMRELFRESKALVLAAHSTSILNQFCNKVLWLEKGEAKMFGALEDILPQYQEHMKKTA